MYKTLVYDKNYLARRQRNLRNKQGCLAHNGCRAAALSRILRKTKQKIRIKISNRRYEHSLKYEWNHFKFKYDGLYALWRTEKRAGCALSRRCVVSSAQLGWVVEQILSYVAGHGCFHCSQEIVPRTSHIWLPFLTFQALITILTSFLSPYLWVS